MNLVRVSPQAHEDLEAIWNYVARQSPRAADRLVERIAGRYQLLADAPETGGSCEQYGTGLRQFPVGNYVIFYKPLPGGIEIVRVLHGARDFPSFFQD